MENTVRGANLPASCVVMPGVFVDPLAEVGEDVCIGPNAVVLADKEAAPTRIAAGVQIGANATIYPGVSIGAKARIRPGAVIHRSIPPKAIVEGNPARITGYVDTPGRGIEAPVPRGAARIEPVASAVKGVKLHTFPLVPDIRGTLSVGEFSRDIPFNPLRYFMVFDVPSSETRGEHAHHRCHQFLIAVKGSVSVVADDGTQREEFKLDRPNLGLYLPPKTWGIQYHYSSDALLLVFASDYYDPDDYIRDYSEFVDLTKARAGERR